MIQPLNSTWQVPVCASLFLLALFCLSSSCRAADTPASLDQLPKIRELPDPFLLPDGQRIGSKDEWPSQRRHLQDLILDYEYGHLPPTSAVKAEETGSKTLDHGATEKQIVLHVGPKGEVAVPLILTIPAGGGKHPAVVEGDLWWGRGEGGIVGEGVRRGGPVAEVDPTELWPGKKGGGGWSRARFLSLC